MKKWRKQPKPSTVEQIDSDYITDSKASVLFNTPPVIHKSLYLVILFFIIIAIWANFAALDEVTVAQGEIIPSGEVQIIQNLEGGVIESINVQESQAVKKGDILLQINAARFAAPYYETLTKYQSLVAKRARLKAQVDGKDHIIFPNYIHSTAPKLIEREEKIFRTKRLHLRKMLMLLEENYKALEEESNITLPLAERGLLSKIEPLNLQRKMNDIQQKMEDLTAKFNTSALNDLNQTDSDIAELKETLFALKDRMERATVRSPVDGTVNNLAVTTVGGVISPGMHIMEVVPDGDALVIEAKIEPDDIAFINLGQEATIKVSAYDFSIYGGVPATITHISPTTINEGDKTYYEVKLNTIKKFIQYANAELPIKPGMTVTADILTGKKTVFDYILKPILKTKQAAMRER